MTKTKSALEFLAFLLFAFILFGGWNAFIWILRIAWATGVVAALVILGYVIWLYAYLAIKRYNEEREHPQ